MILKFDTKIMNESMYQSPIKTLPTLNGQSDLGLFSRLAPFPPDLMDSYRQPSAAFWRDLD
jgi:hypothetical protein